MLSAMIIFLSLGCLAFLLPLDIWRFVFHSTITEKFINRRLRGEVKYALIARWIYVYWILFAIIILLSGNLVLKYKIDLNDYALYPGFALFLAGISLAVWAATTLGIKVGRRIPEVSPSETVHLITKGPYRIVRHPIYLGEFLVILGVFLVSGATVILAQFILKALFANSVIAWEEKEMKNRFGKEYEQYQKIVPKLFPISWKRTQTRKDSENNE
jgi:protein-S-isoprenylcysteine O-methyltransferase Ste14